jgi:hypothetical protein
VFELVETSKVKREIKRERERERERGDNWETKKKD